MIYTRQVRQRTEIFSLAWGCGVTLRGWQLWNFIQFFTLTQAPLAWNYRDLKVLAKISRQQVLSYTKVQPYLFTQALPLSFRRLFNLTLTFQFKNPHTLNPSIIAGLQFPVANYLDEDLEDFEILQS